jgi:hypothetical protein
MPDWSDADRRSLYPYVDSFVRELLMMPSLKPCARKTSASVPSLTPSATSAVY